jgi:pimeloyl-ACP methyl ester carboxylesterase
MADVTVRNLRFHYQRLGSGGATVVFLHGLVMDNLSSFYFTMAPRVASFATAILYDLRGHGNTDKPPSGYALPEMVADLSELLSALSVKEPVFLVGHSFGGLVAQAFAVSYPERTAGIVLIDGLSSQSGWAEQMAGTLRLEGEERNRRIAESFRNWLGRHSQRKSTRLAVAAEALVYHTSLVADLRSSPHLTDDQLRGIRCPVRIVCGEQSDMRTAGEHLARILPGSEIHIVPGCTHSVLWEATGEVCELVVSWLRHATDSRSVDSRNAGKF